MNFFMRNENCCFIASCNNFIKNQDYSYIDWMSSRTQCFYYDSNDYESVCCVDGVSFSINNFCFLCQGVDMQELSNKLFMSEICFQIMKKQFCVCCCLVDCYFYVTRARSFTLFTGKQKVNNVATITVVNDKEIVSNRSAICF